MIADEKRCVFLLVGNEEFLKQDWADRLRQKVAKNEDPGSVDFNRFSADETDLKDILAIARTPPLLTSKRLIIINAIERVASQPNQTRLLAYVNAPHKATLLILETGISQKDFLKNDFLSGLGKAAEVVYFKRLYNSDLLNWIMRRFTARKKKPGPGAAELLAQLKGNNLSILDKEIEKLCLYAADRDTIAREDVEQLVGKDVAGGVDEIIGAISQADKKKALAISLDFQKKDLGNAIGLFCWNLRQLLRVKEVLKEGWPPMKIESGLRLQRFQVERFIGQSKTIKKTWIRRALSELAEFDLAIKTPGLRDAALGWQLLIVRLLALL